MSSRPASASDRVQAVTVTVFLASALLCIGSDCHPALVGKDTPVGRFGMVRRPVSASGYGGDVMQFGDSPKGIFAIHRVWLGRPAEQRAQRLAGDDAARRRGVTNGCINVTPAVYDAIVDETEVDIRP